MIKVAPEGRMLVATLAGVALAGGVLLHPGVGLALAAPAAFTFWFFRDPERAVPDERDVMVSPADGRVLGVRDGRLSVFMNVFDVHVCRAPVSGRVETVVHTPGRFLSAFKEAASEQNERVSIVLSEGERRVRFTLVAGLVARRIVCRVAPGARVATGERIGVIRFGSRVDVELPQGYEPSIEAGRRVRAGVTPIARPRVIADRERVPDRALRDASSVSI